MSKPDYVDFQDRTSPLAFLITFRCYGTWLHGEERGSIDRRNFNRYGTPDMPANTRVLDSEKAELKNPAVLLNRAQRELLHLRSEKYASTGRICSTRLTSAQIMFILW
jgi:hypothetical protein